MVEFSVVVPVSEKDFSLIPKTIPSWFSLTSDDFLICVDKPVSSELRNLIQSYAKFCGVENNVRIVEVGRSNEWSFHQAHVRREGFHQAKHDRILTGDIDLVVNSNVYKALNLVGKNNIGLVSLSKFRYPRNLVGYYQAAVLFFLRNVVHGVFDFFTDTTTFSGLYAIWRPYWLATEPEEEVKQLVNPKQFFRGERPSLENAVVVTGEDSFLRDCMIKKYRCIYLRDIGAVDIGKTIEELPYIQFMVGQYFAHRGRSMMLSFGRALLRAQPYYLKGYLHGKFGNK